MAVAFRAATNAVQGTAANVACNTPAGATTGDILLAGIYLEDDQALTKPADTGAISWTLLDQTDHPSVAFDHYLFWGRLASSPAASYTWTHSSAYRTGWIAAFSGAVASGSPFDGTASGNTGTDITAECNGLTLAETDSMLVACAAYWSDRTSTVPTGSPTFTERVDPGNNVYVATASATASGATGTKTINPASSVEWASIMVALRSQVSGAAATAPPPWSPMVALRPLLAQ